jgi:hypothetical protein
MSKVFAQRNEEKKDVPVGFFIGVFLVAVFLPFLCMRSSKTPTRFFINQTL